MIWMLGALGTRRAHVTSLSWPLAGLVLVGTSGINGPTTTVPANTVGVSGSCVLPPGHLPWCEGGVPAACSPPSLSLIPALSGSCNCLQPPPQPLLMPPNCPRFLSHAFCCHTTIILSQNCPVVYYTIPRQPLWNPPPPHSTRYGVCWINRYGTPFPQRWTQSGAARYLASLTTISPSTATFLRARGELGTG